MPGQRKEGKRLWGGYLEGEDFDRLDEDARRRGFSTRTEFLIWLARNCGDLILRRQKPEGGSKGKS